MKRKSIATLAAATLAISGLAAGCGDDDDTDDDTDTSDAVDDVADTMADAVTVTTAG